jgi:hypothetical protein
LVHAGKHKDTYRKEKGNVPTLLCKINDEPVVVTRDEVKKYVNDPMFCHFMGIYNYTKLWGMPNGNGWANEPCEILEGITALELEAKAIEHEEMENARERSTSNPKSTSNGRKSGK